MSNPTHPEHEHTVTSILHKLMEHVPWYNDSDLANAKAVVSEHFDPPTAVAPETDAGTPEGH